MGAKWKESLFYHTRISKRELHKRRVCLKYLSLRCKNYTNLNYSLTKTSFFIMVFNLFMLIPHFKLVMCFSIADKIVSTVKLFADDISIFSAVNDANISADELNKDLQKISEWFYRWKMSFNLDWEVVFFRKIKKSITQKSMLIMHQFYVAIGKNI